MTTSANQNTILLCNVHKDATDEALKKKMKYLEGMLALNLSKSGYILTIDGYDNDSRELWEIPKIKEFAGRLVDLGFISLLEVNTYSKRNEDPLYNITLGAFEVWALSKGILNSKYLLTEQLLQEFTMVLLNSNIACARITGGVKK